MKITPGSVSLKELEYIFTNDLPIKLCLSSKKQVDKSAGIVKSASADLEVSGKQKLSEIGLTLKETTNQIPKDIDWIIMVEGHTDKRPINTFKFPSNWELSTARANSVLKLLLDIGFAPDRLAAAGYGEFYPISNGDTDSDYQQNRRIELKLTSR